MRGIQIITFANEDSVKGAKQSVTLSSRHYVYGTGYPDSRVFRLVGILGFLILCGEVIHYKLIQLIFWNNAGRADVTDQKPIGVLACYIYRIGIIGILCIFLLISCGKDKDTLPPVISVTLPHENETFNVLDEILVNAVVSDDHHLEYVTIVLTDQNYVAAMPSFSYYPENSTFELNAGYLLDNIQLESGVYYMLVKAGDGINDKNEFIKLYINGVDRELKHIYLITSNAGQVKVIETDSAGNLNVRLTIQSDFSAAAASSRYQLLYIAGSVTGDLKAYDIIQFQEQWAVPSQANPPFVCFEGIEYYNEKLYVAFHDGHWAYYDQYGSVQLSQLTDTNWIPLKFLPHEQLLITEQRELSGFDHKIAIYYWQTGAILQQYISLMQVIAMFPDGSDDFYIFGNESGQAFVRLFSISGNNYWQPNSLPSGIIRSVTQAAAGNYIIAHQSGLYHYIASSNTLLNPKPGLDASLVRYDDVNELVWVVQGTTTISVYAYPGFQFIGNITSPEPVKEVLFVYNKD